MIYQQCLKEVESLIGHGIHRGLDRMREAVRCLDNPQNKFKSVHIAGTNGKGSTACFVTEILKHAGYKVGLTLSPHVESIRERIQINGQHISEEQFVLCHQNLKNKLQDRTYTYYEWTILMAFTFFAKEEVELAVIETGMGGRWDATNVVQPLIAAITNISFDHQAFLGSTLEEILEEKMQIIKPGVVAWTGIQEESLLKRLREYCESKNILLYSVPDYYCHHLDDTFSIFEFIRIMPGLRGDHQKRNAALALGIVRSLKEKGFNLSNKCMEEGIKKSYLPGRLEIIQESPQILIDGAHNLGGIEALVNTIKNEKQKYHLVFGTLKDRPFAPMLKLLSPHVLSVSVALFNDPRTFLEEDIEKLQKELSQELSIAIGKVRIDKEGWPDFISRFHKSEKILVTGSLYLVSDVRSLVKEFF